MATVMVVVAFENVPDAPEPGDVNVTFAPETGLFPASRTVTPSGVAKTVLTVADCGVVPAFVVIEVAAPTRLVRAKLTVDRPDAAAVTLYAPPAIAFAVNGADAIPDEFVATVMVFVAFEKVPDAPDPGDVNVTFTPETGLLPASRTVTPSGVAKAVLTVADCGVVPAFVVIEVAAPVLLVSEKFTVVRPVEAADTL